MKFSQRQVIILLGGVVAVIIIGVVVFLNVRPKPSSGPALTLSVWGTEDKTTVGTLLSSYPYATVTYTQIDSADYQTKLLNALAAGTGPDVFEINNRSLPKWQTALAPMPAVFATQFNVQRMDAEFPDVVVRDFVAASSSNDAVPTTGQIYALPLSVDTLAMFYNKDLFNSRGIAFPPKTWDEFAADVPKLRTVGPQGQLVQAAAAIGGSETSIANAPDLVFLLMLQNGTRMVSNDLTSAQFATNPSGPGIAAFNFYLQFANAASPSYTWNDGVGSAIDAFASGKVAILFGYASDLATIKKKAPFLNMGIAPMPQATGATVAVNYPKYNGFAAAKVGQSVLAWNYILYITTNDTIEQQYMTETGAPPALRNEIQTATQDPDLGVFATQALTARSWHEADDGQIDSAMNQAIQNVLNGSADSWRALQVVQSTVNSLMTQP